MYHVGPWWDIYPPPDWQRQTYEPSVSSVTVTTSDHDDVADEDGPSALNDIASEAANDVMRELADGMNVGEDAARLLGACWRAAYDAALSGDDA